MHAYRLAAALILCICTTLAAAAPWRSVSEATFVHPLSDASPIDGPVIAVEQDGAGFVWFIAGWRLWRWDGHELQPARLPANAPESAGGEMYGLAPDGKGGLWVGGTRALFRAAAGTLDLERVPVPPAPSLSMQRIAVASGNVLIVAGDRAVHRLDIAANRVEPIAIPADTRVHALLVDREATLWIGTGRGLYSMPVAGTQSPRLVAAPFAEARIAALHESADGALWVGTSTAGAFMRPRRGEFRRIDVEPGQEAPWIFTITEARPGVVWLGSFGRGIYEVEASSGAVLRHHRNNRLLPSSLSDDNVWTMRRDNQGIVWVGTGRTLGLHDSRSGRVLEIPGDIGRPNGLSRAAAYALLPVGKELWVGTAGGIERLDSERGHLGRISFAEASRGEADPVEVLFDDGDRGIVASTSFLTWRLRPGQPPRLLEIPNRDKGAFTSAYARFDGALWLGGTDGLWRMPDGGGAPVNVLANAGQRRVASLLVDGDTLWIGSWLGLLRMTANGEPERVSHPRLDTQYVSALRRSPSGDLWMGTTGAGVFVLDRKGTWKIIDESQGLQSLIVADIRFDAAGVAWISTQRGIASVDPKTLQVVPVVFGKGAVATPYRRGSSTALDGGLFAFGGRRGITLIDTQYVDPTPPATPMALTRMEDGGRNMSFEFAALDYLRPETIRYRYRLRGDSEGWQMVDARRRVATFTRLPPGAYTFEAQYTRDGITWSTPPLEHRFEIPAAWHENAAVRAAGLVLLAFLLFILHGLRTRVLEARAARLEKAVADRTADLETANAQLAVQAKELEQASLTDALTGLRNRRFIDQNIGADLSLLHRRRKERPDGHDADFIVVLVDIDRFKQINDQYGHPAGDAVLAEMANRLRDLFRETDYLVRWGGEEFLVLVRFTDRARCDEIAERVRTAVGNEPFDIGLREKLKVTCSTGVAVYPLLPSDPFAFTWGHTLAFADAALYGAKQAGRNAWISVKGPGPAWSDPDSLALREEPALVLQRAEVARNVR